jgi:hypothetical protein
MTELRARLVEGDRSGAVPAEREGPLRRTAPVVQDVVISDVTEDAELGLGDAPHSPGGGSAHQVGGVGSLVVVGVSVPELAVAALVIGDGHSVSSSFSRSA